MKVAKSRRNKEKSAARVALLRAFLTQKRRDCRHLLCKKFAGHNTRYPSLYYVAPNHVSFINHLALKPANMKIIVIMLCLLGCGLSFAQEKIYVQNPAVFIDGGSIRESVREECNLEPYLGNQAFKAISKFNENAVSTSDAALPDDAPLLTLSILAVTGHGGAAAYTGGKSMTVRVDYKMGGRVLATKTLTVGSRGGFFGGFKGICSILQRDANTIAKQISVWFKQLPPQQSLMSASQANVVGTTATVGESGKETIYLISPILYRDDNRIRQSIKDECALPALTETYMLEQGNAEKYPIKSLSSYNNKKGVAMNVSITDAVGGSAGRYDGDRLVKMHVDLMRDGDVISSKDFETKNNMVFIESSCQIFQQLVRSFAKDSVKWAIGQLSSDAKSDLVEKTAENKLGKNN